MYVRALAVVAAASLLQRTLAAAYDVRAMVAGKERWADMSNGAKRRYGEQIEAYKDIRDEIDEVTPGLVDQLDYIYRHD